MTAILIRLNMFIEQHKGRSGSGFKAVGPIAVPPKNWKVGYVLTSGTNPEQWTIKEIVSNDGKLHREDCTVKLKNAADEIRDLKGSSLMSGSYAFFSTGDVVEEPTVQEREDVMPFAVAIAGIREFYPRKNGEGCRLLMHDKTAYIVLEDFRAIWKLIETAGAAVGKTKDGAIVALGGSGGGE